MQAPALNPRLAETLAALRAEGIDPTDAEIVWLGRLRARCDEPDDGSVPWVMGAPLNYAGVPWYPLHRLAESWFMRAHLLCADNARDQVLAFLFAHAHSAPGDDTVRDYSTADAIAAELRRWADTLPLHDGQLEALCKALRQLDGQNDGVPDPDAQPDASDTPADNLPQFVSTMCRVFPGTPPQWWLTECPAHEARRMLSDASEGGGWATSARRAEAIGNYLRAVKWIWRNHGIL